MVIYADDIAEAVKRGELPEVTDENYYDDDINKAYLSFHTWLSFHGSYGIPACEAKARAILDGEYVEDKDTTAFMVGSYVDAALVGGEGEFEKFKAEHPEIFKKDKTLKAEYVMAEKMIARCKQDEKFMMYVSGVHQLILVCYLFGVPFKCKLDSFIPHHALCDLKTTRELHRAFFVPDMKTHVDFITYYDYIGQLSCYQEAVRIVFGEKLPVVIAAITKSNHPEPELIEIDDISLYEGLTRFQLSIEKEHFVELWKGEIPPVRCNRPDCAYCCDTKVLKGTINYRDLINE